MKRPILLFATLINCIFALHAQNNETPGKNMHMIGIKTAYNLSGSHISSTAYTMKNIRTFPNFSISYTSYMPLWESIDIFGCQLSLSRMQQGYESELTSYSGTQIDSTVNTLVNYNNYLFPFVSQFHIDFWKMRLLLNAGGFVGYRTDRTMLTSVHKHTLGDREEEHYTIEESGFAKGDYKWDYGFTAGGGIAFVFKPLELHIEANYNYSFAYLYAPDKFDTDKSYLNYLYTHPHQLHLSVSLHFHL